MKTTLDAHIEQTPGVLGGKPRIAGHRIGVHHVAHWHLVEGQSVDQIAGRYGLSLAAVYAALAYYFDHREEIDARSAADDAWVEEQIRLAPPSKLREKLKQMPPPSSEPAGE